MKDISYYPDGTFIGIITDIQATNEPYYCVTVTVALAIDGKITKYKKYFENPFTKGRKVFQNFCESFDLFSDRKDWLENYVLELDQAISCLCIAVLSPDLGFESIAPLADTDLRVAFGLDDRYENIHWFQPETYCTEKDMTHLAPEIREERQLLKRDLILLKNVSYSKTNLEIPTSFQKYRKFPPMQLGTPCVGFIETIQLKKDRFQPDELMLRCHVAIADKGHIVHKDYYINRIRSTGRGDYEHFCATFGLPYEEDNFDEPIDPFDLQNACFVPLTIHLYQSPKSGNVYVERLEKHASINPQDEMQMMLFTMAYEKYFFQEHSNFDFDEC